MMWHERVAHVRLYGFTDRQAAFLVTVMLHAGVCIGRQYYPLPIRAPGVRPGDARLL
jgi:hypothetical protein